MASKMIAKHSGDYIVSDKLDGNSAVTLDLKDKKITKSLYSRGNGTFGRDITHLLQYIYIPKDDILLILEKLSDSITVRGEL